MSSNLSPFKDKHGNILTWKVAIQKIQTRLNSYVLEFYTGFLWWFVGAIPFHFIRRFFYRIGGVKIGRNSTIHMFGRMYNPANITIGRGTLIGDGVVLDGRARLEIGDHVEIASQVMIFNSEHDLSSKEFKAREEPVKIEEYVFIGPRAIILPGVSIGRGAVVAAGAVVTKSVDALRIVAGVPAKEIGTRDEKTLVYKLGRPRLFQ